MGFFIERNYSSTKPPEGEFPADNQKEEMAMKRAGAILTSLGVLFLYANLSFAADSNTLTVSASVAGTCKFSSATSTLNFGALDPSVGSNVNASGSTQFWCTKGVSTDAVAGDNGAHWSGSSRQMHDTVSGDNIPYSLTLTKDGNPNNGPTSPRTLTIDGTVLGTDYSGVSAGNYSDTVMLTINP
jgi:spore coat protein U-like protein